MTDKERTKTSKFLSLILRHEPERVGLTLDEAGWIGVDELLDAVNRNGARLTRDLITSLRHATNSDLLSAKMGIVFAPARGTPLTLIYNIHRKRRQRFCITGRPRVFWTQFAKMVCNGWTGTTCIFRRKRK